MYKIHALILTERIREEIERKSLLLSSQASFRKGREMMDNIYVLSDK